MKKVIVILAVLALAMPSMAASITVTGTPSTLTGTVGFSGNGQNARPDAARASGFALTLETDNGATFETVTPTITGVSKAATPGYGIFPGTIVIDDNGVVTDYNTPVEKSSTPGAGSSGLHTTKIVVALGALYVTDANKPGASGNLFSFTVSKACTVTMAVESTYRGGVIAEDSNPMTVTFTGNPIVIPGNTPPAPGAPTNVLASDGTAATTITVSWTPPVGGTTPTGYDVYKSFTNNSATATKVTATPVAGSPYTFSAGATQTTAHGETTYFWVKSVATGSAGDSVFSNGDAGYIIEAMKATTTPASWRTDWVAWGRPDCWAYQRNCRGDYDGLQAGFWVSLNDLNKIKLAFNKTDAQLLTIDNGFAICADFDHLKAGFRVSLNDLNLLKLYFNKLPTVATVCPNTNYNFWKN